MPLPGKKHQVKGGKGGKGGRVVGRKERKIISCDADSSVPLSAIRNFERDYLTSARKTPNRSNAKSAEGRQR